MLDRRYVSAILWAASVVGLAAPSSAEVLRFTTLTAGAPPPAASVSPTPGAAPPPSQRSSFRHTFGAERRVAEDVRLAPRVLHARADIYLLSGVTTAPTVRRLFPAANWNVVLSRQLTLPPGERGSERGTTGVAIRTSETLRIVRLEHIATDLGRPLPGEVAATAALLRVAGQRIWIVAVDIAPPCANGESEACRAAEAAKSRFTSWLDERRSEGVPILIAGPNAGRVALETTASAPPARRTARERPPPDDPGLTEIPLIRRGMAALLAADRQRACSGAAEAEAQIVLLDSAGVAVPAEHGWQVPSRTTGDDRAPCLMVLDVTLAEDLR